MDTLTLVILLLIVIVIVGMAAAIMISNERAKKERALAVIKGQSTQTDESGNKLAEQDKRRAEIAQKLKESGDEDKSKKKVTIKNQLQQAGLAWSVRRYWIFSIIIGVTLAVVSKLMGMSVWVVCMLLIIGLFGIPKFFLRTLIKRRQKKFLEEFADALEAMVRLLKAGMPVTEAIAMAGREFSGPVGDEMLRVYDAQKIGVPLPEATMEAAQRMPLTEMQMFATGIAIQTQTGASLSEVLMNLAGVIRSRFRLKRKVQALSSEAKASAMIIGSLPFLVGSGLFFINPDYIGLLFNTLPGKIMVCFGIFWMGCGIMVMKIMINFKV